jgi:hypothetical protein
MRQRQHIASSPLLFDFSPTFYLSLCAIDLFVLLLRIAAIRHTRNRIRRGRDNTPLPPPPIHRVHKHAHTAREIAISLSLCCDPIRYSLHTLQPGVEAFPIGTGKCIAERTTSYTAHSGQNKSLLYLTETDRV